MPVSASTSNCLGLGYGIVRGQHSLDYLHLCESVQLGVVVCSLYEIVTGKETDD